MATYKLAAETLTLSDEHPDFPGVPLLYSQQLQAYEDVVKGQSLWKHIFHSPDQFIAGQRFPSETYGKLIAEWGSKKSRIHGPAGKLAARYCSRWPEGPQIKEDK
jgi:hypothetical protein